MMENKRTNIVNIILFACKLQQSYSQMLYMEQIIHSDLEWLFVIIITITNKIVVLILLICDVLSYFFKNIQNILRWLLSLVYNNSIQTRHAS